MSAAHSPVPPERALRSLPALPIALERRVVAALSQLEREQIIGPGTVVLLTGALAQGLGCAGSELSFEALQPADNDVQLHEGEIAGQRIVVRFSDRAARRELIAQVHAMMPHATGFAALEDLDRYHGFCHGLPVRGGPRARAESAEFCGQTLALRTQALASSLALRELCAARALLDLRCEDEGRDALCLAVELAAVAWLAARGDSYVGDGGQWRPLQLGRMCLDPWALASYRSFPRTIRQSDSAGALAHCRALFRAFGRSDGAEFEQPLVLRAHPDARAWVINGRAYVTKQDELFVLDSAGVRAWRQLSGKAGVAGRALRRHVPALAVLHGCSLTEASLPGVIAGVQYDGRLAHGVRTPIGLDGAVITPARAATLLDVSPKSLLEAGGEILLSAFILANTREDLAGALDAEQWPTFECEVNEAVLAGVAVVIAAKGLGIERRLVLRQAHQTPNHDPEILDEAERLLCARVRSRADAAIVLRDLGRWLRTLPVDLNDPRVARSHETAVGFLNLIQVTKGWLRMARALSVSLPHHEADYTVRVYEGSVRSMMRLKTYLKMATWQRELVLPGDEDERVQTIPASLMVLARSMYQDWRARV